MEKTQSWTVTPAGFLERKSAHDLLRASELTLDGLETTQLWCVKGEKDSILGVAGLEAWGNQGLLRSVAVDKKYQRSGIGVALVKHIIKESKKRRLSGLYLLTETAQLFFEKLGFGALDRSEVRGEVLRSVEFKTACSQTATVMRLKLELSSTS